MPKTPKKVVKAWAVTSNSEVPILRMPVKYPEGKFWPWTIFGTKELAKLALKKGNYVEHKGLKVVEVEIHIPQPKKKNHG